MFRAPSAATADGVREPEGILSHPEGTDARPQGGRRAQVVFGVGRRFWSRARDLSRVQSSHDPVGARVDDPVDSRGSAHTCRDSYGGTVRCEIR
jgi:hypothetical protein